MILMNKIKLEGSKIMNILMIVDDLNIGGTATHILSISKELMKKNFKITVISGTDEMKSVFEDIDIKVIHLDFNDKLNCICEKVKEYIHLNSIETIHAHLSKSIEIANQMKRKYDINYIVTLHGMFYDEKVIKMCKNSLGIICVSYPIKKEVIKILGIDTGISIEVIPNFVTVNEYKTVDIRKKLNINKNIKLITYCSRLSSSKGILAERFLFEFYQVAKEREDVHAILIGDGVRKRNIDFYIQSMNESLGRNCIHSTGSVYYPQDYFKESCIVVGTGRVILEGLSCGATCIAIGSMGYAGIIEPDNYEMMYNTYFGEHEIPKYVNRSFKESLYMALDSKYDNDLLINNESWIDLKFNKEKCMLDLIDMYKFVKNITKTYK
ncbi:glycosyltransferase [Clostridium sp.]|uniref:glycosyltransferase n=1 Tax=Clostridium sp. TaxID=1506 RepID=UPI003F66C2BF